MNREKATGRYNNYLNLFSDDGTTKNLHIIPDLGPMMELRVEVSTDAALNNLNEGVDSTGVQLVLVIGKNRRCTPIVVKPTKLKK